MTLYWVVVLSSPFLYLFFSQVLSVENRLRLQSSSGEGLSPIREDSLRIVGNQLVAVHLEVLGFVDIHKIVYTLFVLRL